MFAMIQQKLKKLNKEKPQNIFNVFTLLHAFFIQLNQHANAAKAEEGSSIRAVDTVILITSTYQNL